MDEVEYNEIMYYVYFIRSASNNKIYVGKTGIDPKLRLQQHNSGSNKFTKQNGPWELVYYETYNCKDCARTREKFYKTGFGKSIKKILVDQIGYSKSKVT